MLSILRPTAEDGHNLAAANHGLALTWPQVERPLSCLEDRAYCGNVHGDEERAVTVFADWLRHGGWKVTTEVDFVDVSASRGGERLFAGSSPPERLMTKTSAGTGEPAESPPEPPGQRS